MFKILCSVFSVLFVGYVSGTCSWPDVFVNTVWRDSSKGEITFTADQLSGWTITITGAQNSPQFNTWRCHSTALYESDQILVMITEGTLSPYGKQLYGYICLKLTEITPFSYRYYLYYTQESNTDYERVAMRESDSEDNFGILCSLEDPFTQNRPADSEYRVMLKSSSLTSTKVDCPYVFLGSYDYSHTFSDGTVTCDRSANVMSTCTDSTEISFDYTTCSTKVAYSVSDKVWCVDNVPSGGINYITVYNGYDADAVIDNVDVYQFACFALSEDGTTASIAPNSCRKDQTADVFPTSGGNNIGSLLALTRSTESCLTCPLVTVPDSGSVSYLTLGGVTSASYSCSSEYSLAGPETRICQSNNSWTDEDPTCTCIAPSVPANGSIVISVDGTLTYSCDVGFVLHGDRTRECLTNSNTWSGLEPSCECPDGKYGQNCAKTCSQKCTDGLCDNVDGKCIHGCKPGYIGTNCEQKCDKGMYGEECTETCGYCLAGVPCDHENGTCLDGCLAGYHGQLCKSKCSDGHWGQDCKSVCGHCADSSTCSIFTGTCPGACKPGWLQPLCIYAESHVEKDGQFNSAAIIIGPTVAVVTGVAVIITLLLVLKRRNSLKPGKPVEANDGTSAPDINEYERVDLSHVDVEHETQYTELQLYEHEEEAVVAGPE